jgi:hypothetical protein
MTALGAVLLATGPFLCGAANFRAFTARTRSWSLLGVAIAGALGWLIAVIGLVGFDAAGWAPSPGLGGAWMVVGATNVAAVFVKGNLMDGLR